jgi:hypothetical protein
MTGEQNTGSSLKLWPNVGTVFLRRACSVRVTSLTTFLAVHTKQCPVLGRKQLLLTCTEKLVANAMFWDSGPLG